MIKQVICSGGIVLNEQQQLILIQQVGGSWSLPKGHIDPSETEVETARREIEEESGITELSELVKIGSYSRQAIREDGTFNENELKLIHVYLCTTNQQLLKPKNSDAVNAKWVTCDEAIELLTHPNDKLFLKQHKPQILTNKK